MNRISLLLLLGLCFLSRNPGKAAPTVSTTLNNAEVHVEEIPDGDLMVNSIVQDVGLEDQKEEEKTAFPEAEETVSGETTTTQTETQQEPPIFDLKSMLPKITLPRNLKPKDFTNPESKKALPPYFANAARYVTIRPFLNTSHCLTFQIGVSAFILSTRPCLDHTNFTLPSFITEYHAAKLANRNNPNASTAAIPQAPAIPPGPDDPLSQCFQIAHRENDGPDVIKIRPCATLGQEPSFVVAVSRTSILERVKLHANVMAREPSHGRMEEWTIDEVKDAWATRYNLLHRAEQQNKTSSEQDKKEWLLRFRLNQPVTKFNSLRWLRNLRDYRNFTGPWHTTNPDYSYLPSWMPAQWRDEAWRIVEGAGLYRTGYLCWNRVTQNMSHVQKWAAINGDSDDFIVNPERAHHSIHDTRIAEILEGELDDDIAVAVRQLLDLIYSREIEAGSEEDNEVRESKRERTLVRLTERMKPVKSFDARICGGFKRGKPSRRAIWLVKEL